MSCHSSEVIEAELNQAILNAQKDKQYLPEVISCLKKLDKGLPLEEAQEIKNFALESNYESPMSSLCLRIMRTLLEAGAKPDHTLFFAACQAGQLEFAQLLFEYHVDVYRTQQDGTHALILANRSNNTDLIAWLAGSVPDLLDLADHQGMTVLHHACNLIDPNRVRLLLKCGANPNLVTSIMSNIHTPLIAVINSHLAYDEKQALIHTLINEYGAQVNLADKRKETPLHHACYSAHPDVVFQLLKSGADPTLETEQGFRALDYASRRSPRCSQILLQHHHGEDYDLRTLKRIYRQLPHQQKCDVRIREEVLGLLAKVMDERQQIPEEPEQRCELNKW